MGAKEFGGLVERRMAELDISQNRLASRLGELEDGRIFDATQVRLIREGRRRLDHVLVSKLIDLLEIDPAEGWAAAGLLPRGVTADMLRRLDIFASHDLASVATGRSALTRQSVKTAVKAQGMATLIQFPVRSGAQVGHVERSDRRRRYRRTGDSRKRVRTPRFVAEAVNTLRAGGTSQVGRPA
jgi:hypothetical protein